MRTRFLFISLLLPLMVFCNKQDPQTTPSDNQGTNTEEKTDDEARFIKDGATICVVNPEVQKYLEEVKYTERDYSVSYLKNYQASPGTADVPPFFTIKWEKNDAAGALKASLSEPTWSREWDIKAGLDTVDITNLRPNTTYQYAIKSAADPSIVLTSGSFNTTGLLHQVYFKMQVRNARDLGGWKTKDGKTVKYRKIYRGGRLESGTLSKTKGLPEILAEGIKAQLDLRGHTSSGTDEFLHESALGADYSFLAPVIEEGYRDMLEDDAAKTKMCIDYVISSLKKDEPVYFHCSLGRDRTGTLAMLLLGLAGVDEGDISKDYELTQFSPKGWGVCEGESFDNSKSDAKYHVESNRMSRCQQWGYKHAAEYVWSKGASGDSFQTCVEKYLLGIGVSQDDINWYKTNMVE